MMLERNRAAGAIRGAKWQGILLLLWASTAVLLGENPVQKPENGRLFPPQIRTVGIISPACMIAPEALDRCVAFLEAHKVKVKVGSACRFPIPVKALTCAPLPVRVKEFETMWLDPEIDLLIAVRGGIGAEALIGKVDWKKLRTRKAALLGFSNITALQTAMTAEHAGLVFSGPSLQALLQAGPQTREHLCRVLAGENPPPFQLNIIRPGKCEGKVLSANMISLVFSFRCGVRPDTRGKILFLEHTGFTPQKIVQLLSILRSKGIFDSCAGVVFCSLTQKTPEWAEEAQKVTENFAKSLPCPAFMGYPYGHDKVNLTIDQQSTAFLSEDGVLTFQVQGIPVKKEPLPAVSH
ncbi:MAG: LD-carboxypeptidase [Victivallaceae bacterium]|nr:LD-carboxypeptidase [Victivallaceae bacterium]